MSSCFRKYIDRKGPVYDGLGFTFTVIFAVALDWQARDIAWAFWISSLCIGYATCVWVLAKSLVPNLHNAGRRKKTIFVVFFMAFFTLHFGGFHYIHCMFLNGVLPLWEMEDGIPNIFVPIRIALVSYWPLILAALVSRVRELRNLGSDKNHMGIVLPYLSVVRLHLLIAALAILDSFGLGSIALYPVLAGCFFPWGTLFKLIAAKYHERRDRAYAEESERMSKELEFLEKQEHD
jgi:hypothetical protein